MEEVKNSYSLAEWEAYQGLLNELDQLLEQWPAQRERTLSLLTQREAHHAQGQPQPDPVAMTLAPVAATGRSRQQRLQRVSEREADPARTIRYARNEHRAKNCLTWRVQSPRPAAWPAAWPWYASPYEWWERAIFMEAMNELDKSLARWPDEQALTLHLLATQEAFFTNGAPHWGGDEDLLPPDPDRPAYDIEVARLLREQERLADPAQAARYARNLAGAQAGLAARQTVPTR